MESIVESRKPQHCALCRNHGIEKRIKGHKKCLYLDQVHIDNCTSCANTLRRRNMGANEIKRIRQRQKLCGQYLADDLSHQRLKRKPQECRKCRNHGMHNLITGGHNKSCPKANCRCKMCNETNYLRESMKIENKTKRMHQNREELVTSFSNPSSVASSDCSDEIEEKPYYTQEITFFFEEGSLGRSIFSSMLISEDFNFDKEELECYLNSF